MSTEVAPLALNDFASVSPISASICGENILTILVDNGSFSTVDPVISLLKMFTSEKAGRYSRSARVSSVTRQGRFL